MAPSRHATIHATSHDRRFRAEVERRLEPGEAIVATARVWSARPSRVPALAARFRDDVVVTDRRLMVWECGWLTRRPRRRVLADRLSDIDVSDLTRRDSWLEHVRRVRIDHAGRRSVVFDIADDEAGQQLAAALLTRAGVAS